MVQLSREFPCDAAAAETRARVDVYLFSLALDSHANRNLPGTRAFPFDEFGCHRPPEPEL
jgi:hypothetical protein